MNLNIIFKNKFKILTILLLIFFIFNQKEDFSSGPKKYKRCNEKKISGILNNIFSDNNISKTYSEDWDVYIPCGYNMIEQELTKITPQNSNQLIFGVSGCDKIVSKNGIWNLLENKFGRKIASAIMPETFVLSNPQHMNLFNKKFNKKNTYILKKNIQRKKGLKLTNNLHEIQNSYKEGFKIVQEYKNNTFLIDDTKMNLRVYVLIICQYGNVDIYIHRQGKCLYAGKKYSKNNMDFDANITDSYKMPDDVYKNKPESFEDLKIYLTKNNYDANLLFKRIDILIQKIGLSTEGNLCQLNKLKNNKTFQLFGVDIIFNDKMYPMLLELNKGPDMIAKNDKDSDMKRKIEVDMFQKVGLVEVRKINYKNEFYPV